MKNYIKLVECTDEDEVYGLLIIEDVSAEIVQDKIYEIKNSDEDVFKKGNWCIEDVIERFPEEWEYEFVDSIDSVEI